MSAYPSAAAFLSDAELRVDAFHKDKLGLLVVEGNDDRRLFSRHTFKTNQVMATGGQRLLLAAHAAATPEQRQSIVFLTDCDYAVRLRELAPAAGLIITDGTDIETDLINLGLLHDVVNEIVPDALDEDDKIAEITEHSLKEAVAFSRPLGRIRMAAKPLGVSLQLEKIQHKKYWPNRGSGVDVDKMLLTTHQKLREGHTIDFSDWKALVEQTPHDDGMCHGKDLMRAFWYSLSKKYSLASDVEVDTVSRLLRANLWPARLELLAVTKRIRAWELSTSLRVLR